MHVLYVTEGQSSQTNPSIALGQKLVTTCVRSVLVMYCSWPWILLALSSRSDPQGSNPEKQQERVPVLL